MMNINNSSTSALQPFKTNPKTQVSNLIPLDFRSCLTLPNSHTWTPSLPHHDRPYPDSVPVIDLSDPKATSLMGHACGKWGVFQATNHGIPTDLIEEAELQTRRLFSLPREQKLRVLRSPEGVTGYGSARISKNFPKLMWSEGFSIMGSPVEHARQLWPRHHTRFCNIMEEYQKEMKGVSGKLIGLMLGSLGLNDEAVQCQWLKPENRGSYSQALLQLNSYPVCPDPTRAMGLAPHTDSSLITLLNQSTTSPSTGGLQVLVDGVRWVPVHPIPGALVVNVGDLMHMLSNGRFKSVVHRVVVNNVHHRISIAYFYGPPQDAKVSPLVDNDQPPLYRPVTWTEYIDYKATHFNKALELIRNAD